MGEQGPYVINGVKLVPLDDTLDPPDYAERSEVRRLQEQINAHTEMFAKLSRFVPAVAEKRKRHGRLLCEIAGVAIAGTGAWWLHPSAALLLVGAWLLGDVIVSRRTEKNA